MKLKSIYTISFSSISKSEWGNDKWAEDCAYSITSVMRSKKKVMQNHQYIFRACWNVIYFRLWTYWNGNIRVREKMQINCKSCEYERIRQSRRRKKNVNPFLSVKLMPSIVECSCSVIAYGQKKTAFVCLCFSLWLSAIKSKSRFLVSRKRIYVTMKQNKTEFMKIMMQSIR